jgi:hypothetical protein
VRVHPESAFYNKPESRNLMALDHMLSERSVVRASKPKMEASAARVRQRGMHGIVQNIASVAIAAPVNVVGSAE